MDMQVKIEEVERELLELIIKHLEENKIDVLTAQKLAKDFLAVLPIYNQQDLLSKLKELGDNYQEAKEVYVQEFSKDITQKEQHALSRMRDAIKQGKIEHAISIAKDLKQTN